MIALTTHRAFGSSEIGVGERSKRRLSDATERPVGASDEGDAWLACVSGSSDRGRKRPGYGRLGCPLWRPGLPTALGFFEHQQRVGMNPVDLHRFGAGLRLHDLLKGGHVRDLHDQPDAL